MELIGKTISHYKILEKIGEGGMGVVYKAQDLKLDRLVALKFLPQRIAVTETEKARFLQEAKAASAVNHPNVCTIYDIAEHQGQQFIVMEYVDGRTLRQMVPVKKVQDVLGYAIQIGEALQEAHGRGVVHRDVKTDNIMVNSKNQVKVMDFGLAKLKGSLKLTKTSSTVGTLAYMAPEQIQGGEVDARSDIFSFGVVLYEMLTGQLPFRGEHEAAMIYSIVNEESEPIQKQLPEISSELVHILNRALEKDPEDRYQIVQEMVIDLRRAKKETSRVSRIPAASPAREERSGIVSEEPRPAATAGRKKPRKTLLLAGLAGVLLVVALIVLLIGFPSRAPKLNPDMTYRVLPIPFTEIASSGLSQDGNWATFPAADANGKWDVYYMNTTSGETRRITSDSSTSMNVADISPDGSQIVYDRYNPSTIRPEIVVVSSVGGSGKKIVDRGWASRWRPDGQRIGYVGGKGFGSQSGFAEFRTVRPNGSDNRCELIDSTSTEARPFSWSPDGRSVCWIRYFSEQHKELMVYNLSTRKARQVTFDKKDIMYSVFWANNGCIFFASNKAGNYNLWMVPASGGSATQITKGAGLDMEMQVSRDGSKLLYHQMQYFGHIWIAGTDGRNPRQITFEDAVLWRVAFFPDGKKVMFGFAESADFEKGSMVYSIDCDGRNRKQFTVGEEGVNNPIPSPDGRWIVYGRHPLSEPSDSSRVYLIGANDPGTPRCVGIGSPMRWIDETSFIIWDFDFHSWLGTIEGGTPKKFFLDSTYAIPLQKGKYIGYYDYRAGREGKWVSAAPGVNDPNLPSPRKLGPRSLYGEFDKSGKFYYWVEKTGELRRISIPSGKQEIVRGVFPGLNLSGSWFDISYDGKEIVYTDARPNDRLVMIENVFK